MVLLRLSNVDGDGLDFILSSGLSQFVDHERRRPQILLPSQRCQNLEKELLDAERYQDVPLLSRAAGARAESAAFPGIHHLISIHRNQTKSTTGGIFARRFGQDDVDEQVR